MTDRSNRPDVRNPVLTLPELQELRKFDPAVREALAALLIALAANCGARAETSWRKHKAPMAVYWKGVGVWAKHIGRAVRP
ncbi:MULTISPECIES: hypothetical protein [unclassified Mesorhizobium]|uniref:hypothetical protein n=1 Tax=unclassified Mesorhizobium TaxID=325217 RepID=UPI00112D7EB8|nr:MULTISPECIES: hypothetical protein [unclassified Mesorhizobium]MCA0025515.1 hypothetical protein [Mesorhizobium sp. B263B1A]TPJ97103.1 hypothetical protein FJ489_11715 [Mesorhizobium sp. B2-5-12]TPK27231.1 hypothetical protein FJ562_08310 [Mesorhizobium sp. B2-5-6]